MSAKEQNKNPAETILKEEREVSKVKLIPIYIMGKRYEVPEGLTIMKAMEYAGYKFIRGCGCRGGTCGACGTVYREPGDYKIQVALACQKAVEPDICIAPLEDSVFNSCKSNIKALEFAACFRLHTV